MTLIQVVNFEEYSIQYVTAYNPHIQMACDIREVIYDYQVMAICKYLLVCPKILKLMLIDAYNASIIHSQILIILKIMPA